MNKTLRDKKFFVVLMVVLVAVKIFLCSFLYAYNDNDQLLYTSGKLKFSNGFYQGGDDFEVFNSAAYYRATDTIMVLDPVHSFYKPSPRAHRPYASAFRPKAFVLMHLYGTQLFHSITGKDAGTVDSPNMHAYFNFYGCILYFLAIAAYIISLFAFYALLQFLFGNELWARAGLILYAIIPSHLLFIGLFDSWENISFYVQVIFFSHLYLAVFAKKSYSTWGALGVALCVLVAFCRPHLLMTFGALLALVVLYALFAKDKSARSSSLRIVVFSVLLLTCGLAFTFWQNNKWFGKPFLSTQSSFEFFQGHNEYARSSWNSHIYEQHKAYFDSAIYGNRSPEQIAAMNLNEYQEASLYKQYADQWMKHHVTQELLLTTKKVAGYFIPYNHLNNRVNLVTVLLEAGFGLFCLLVAAALLRFRKNREQLWQYVFIMAPVLFTIVLTIMFFVGYRWRYYAEPFMLIGGMLAVKHYYDTKRTRNTLNA
ncbi:hypothetical protein [Rurimicrobium arvi]